MSLDRFRRPRMIVLHPGSSAYEAARAMADNGVGAVLVAEDRRLLGMATDRDLAVECLTGNPDPRSTPLREVMSDGVAAVEVGATVEDVVRTMRERACRRVPLTEDGRPVGMVTLDDLLLEGAIDAATARSVVLAQREAAARFKAEGALYPEAPARPELRGRATRAFSRHRARAETAYARLLRSVELRTGLRARAQTELALGIVLGAICRRVTPQEARHLIAQLPSKLQPELERHLDGPDRHITTEAIEAELERQIPEGNRGAHALLEAVCEAIADSVSAGEIESLRGQLPMVMRDLFPPVPFAKAG